MTEYLFAFGFDEKPLFIRPKPKTEFQRSLQEGVFGT